jgi:hypothetical protein
MNETPWDLLGVRRNADAAELKEAYRSTLKRVHSDLNSDSTTTVQEVKEAYNSIIDGSFEEAEEEATKASKINIFEELKELPFRLLATCGLGILVVTVIFASKNALVASVVAAVLSIFTGRMFGLKKHNQSPLNPPVESTK